MYRKKSRGWYKHKDFILIDLACLFMALILAYLIETVLSGTCLNWEFIAM